MNSVIDNFLECGLTEMFPMEPAAGMDIVKVRQQYGEFLAISGGIDKHVLRKTKQDILDMTNKFYDLIKYKEYKEFEANDSFYIILKKKASK